MSKTTTNEEPATITARDVARWLRANRDRVAIVIGGDVLEIEMAIWAVHEDAITINAKPIGEPIP